MSLNHRGYVFGILIIIVVSVCGCDFINSIKEYFQEPSQESSKKPAPAQLPTPVQSTVRPSAPMAANTLARVGDWSITIEEFNDRLSALKEVVPEFDPTDAEARNVIIEELVNQQLIVMGAEQTGLTQQKDIVAAVDEFRRTLIVREVAKQLTENISMSDEEARAFYEQNKNDLVGSVQWHVREIVVPTKEQANSLLTEILQGADFAETARAQSKAESAAAGGDLGFIAQEPFAQMGQALLPLEPGDISGVFKGPKGFYIVKLEEKKGGEQLAYEEVKDDIIQSQTLLKQQQIVLEHLNNLKAGTKIEINRELLK